jgi:peptide/nickel transport system ATP-binding protein
MNILEVKNLRTYFFTPFGTVKAVDGVSFNLEKGDAVGLVGESGCGKTTIAYSIMRLIPLPGKIVEGEILVNGENILELNEKQFKKYRWKELSMVFQGAMAAFNPLFKIGNQISEAILYHIDMSKDEAMNRSRELLELVGIDADRVNNYPWELSGGMRQRAMIAMALAANPTILLADEPTTALDVIVSTQIMDLIKNIRERLNLTMLLITHDISVVAQTCDQVIVMYAGKIVEKSSVTTIFKNSYHPYTTALIKAFPSIKGPNRDLEGIPGNPLDLMNPPEGCRFAPRCNYAKEKCLNEDPPLIEVEENHLVSCHYWKEILENVQ